MLDDKNRIPDIAQPLQNLNQPLPIAGMQSNGGLIEHIESSHQRGPKCSRKLDALRLTARKRRGKPVEREVLQADIIEKPKARLDLHQYAFGNLGLCLAQLKVREKIVAPLEGHTANIGYVLTVNKNVSRFLP